SPTARGGRARAWALPPAASCRRTRGSDRLRDRPGTHRGVCAPVKPLLSVLHDQRELLRIEAGAPDERAVDLGVRHEVADVARFDAPPVLHADGPCDVAAEPLVERCAD